MFTGLPFNLDDLLHLRAIEDNRVEFKASWNDVEAEGITRTACAFANDLLNLNGGYIVIGVEEKDGRPVLPPRGLGQISLDGVQKKIYGACMRIRPDYQPMIFVEHPDGRPILVLFCPGGDNRPYQAPGRDGGPAYFVRQGPQTVQAKGDILRRLMELAAKTPFDDRRNQDAVVLDISPTLVRRFLKEVGSSLAEDPIDDRDLFHKLRLIVPINAHEAPRNIALLFFNEDPDRFFPGARIEVVQFPEDAGGDRMQERVFRGPLSEQVRACLAYLEGMTGSLLEKNADRPESTRTAAYPLDAVREALINAVYHRAYDDPREPVKVYLYPDRMEITSYPGPLPGITREHFLANRQPPPVPARNRRIGDFLKELRLAETRGTGVPKIRRRMEENGNPPPEFEFDDARSYFTIRLPSHPTQVFDWAMEQYLRGSVQPTIYTLKRALQRQPGSDALADHLVFLQIESGQLDAARETLRRYARNLVAGQAWPFFPAAKTFVEMGDEASALVVLREMPPGVRLGTDTDGAHTLHGRDAADLNDLFALMDWAWDGRPDILFESAATRLLLSNLGQQE